jgi:hypothetical protein
MATGEMGKPSRFRSEHIQSPAVPIDDDGTRHGNTAPEIHIGSGRQRAEELIRGIQIKFIRDYMDAQGFIEIETPMLIKSTPEGARDYVVPCRVQPGKFYALPQSPQQLKQLLMVAGYERYFQIARCFRDEDLRGDRQPEFTQLDLEMSFVERDDVLDMVEGLFSALVPAVTPHKRIITPFPKLAYQDVMERYGTDKPDLRFGMELVDLAEAIKGSEFKVFAEALASGGAVKAICAPGCAAYSRKQIDELTEFVKGQGAKGLVTLAYTADGVKSSAAKFLKEAEFAAIADRVGAQAGDLVCLVADQRSVANKTLGLLRLEFRDRLNLAPADFWRSRGWWTSPCLSGTRRSASGPSRIIRSPCRKKKTCHTSKAILREFTATPTTWCATATNWRAAASVFIAAIFRRRFSKRWVTAPRRWSAASGTCWTRSITARRRMAAWPRGSIAW